MKYLLILFISIFGLSLSAQEVSEHKYGDKHQKKGHYHSQENPLFNVYPSIGYSQFIDIGFEVSERLLTEMGTPVFGLSYRDRFGQNHNDFEGYVKYYWSHKAPAVGAFVNINLLPSKKGTVRALAGFGFHYNHCEEVLEFAFNPKISVTIRETIVEAGLKVDLLGKEVQPEMHLTVLRSLRVNF